MTPTSFNRRRLLALLAVSAPILHARTAVAQAETTPPALNDQPEVSEFGNWRVVSIYNNSRAFVIPERLVGNYAETADKSDFGSAALEFEYWSLEGVGYSATLTIDGRYDPSMPDRHHTVNVYLDGTQAVSFEATAGGKQDVFSALGGVEGLTSAHNLRVEMIIGDETLTILDLDMTGLAEALPAMRVIPDYNYNVRGLGQPTENDPNSPSCFITTACCELVGLPDECWELQTLRRFRDEAMLPTPDGRADVVRYYDLAPAILKAIREQRQEQRLLAVYFRFILPSALAARLGFRRTARRLYTAMMRDLTRRFLPV